MGSRYGGYSPPRAPERWDRNRFEAESRGPPVMERDRVEEDYYRRSSPDHGRRPSRGYKEEDRYYYEERERFGAPMPHRPRGGQNRYYDEEIDIHQGAMVPREKERERDIEIDIRRTEKPAREPRGFTRPTFVRRQSSLDVYDRKPMPRYGDRVKEETILMPTAPRRRSPPRYERSERGDFDDIRITDPDQYGDDEFREYHEREISRVRRTAGGTEIVEEEREEIFEKPFPRRGKTKMPMRLVNRRAVIELGYSFEEEGETLIILQALGKEHIDEVIRLSRKMNAVPLSLPAPPPEEKKTTTYIYEHEHSHSPAPPPPPPIIIPNPPLEERVIERRTEIIHDRSPSPPPAQIIEIARTERSNRSPSPRAPPTYLRKPIDHRRRHRSLSAASSHREILIEDDRFESNHMHGPIGALVIPNRERRTERSIKSEIRALEAEKRALKLEREAERLRGNNGITIVNERDDVIEVRKDKKGRMSLRR